MELKEIAFERSDKDDSFRYADVRYSFSYNGKIGGCRIWVNPSEAGVNATDAQIRAIADDRAKAEALAWKAAIDNPPAEPVVKKEEINRSVSLE